MEKLNKYQKEVLIEAIEKKSGGLSLPMGYGKTLISICLGLSFKDTILVVVSKTLIENWINEIKKFFGDTLIYTVLHKDYLKKKFDNFQITNEQLILTTPEVVGKAYTKYNISDYFITTEIVNENTFGQYTIVHYNHPNKPYLDKNNNVLYSTNWGTLIIDEAQKYTKISTTYCKGIGAIYSKHRYCMSGTLFDEPIIERVLGYYILIDHSTFPRNLPAAKRLLSRYGTFTGYLDTLVIRKTNPSFVQPNIYEQIITNDLSEKEQILYTSMKDILVNIYKQVQKFKLLDDHVNVRKFSSYLLAMLGYLRQGIISPILPLASATLDAYDFSCKSELSEMICDKIKKLDLNDYLNNPDSLKSSRITSALNIVNKHPNERLVLFTAFRTNLLIITTFLPKDRLVLTISTTLSSTKRNDILQQFKNTEKAILIITYSIGAEGLNLQCANVVLLLDFYWNAGKTQQAIARVFRQGQTKDVFIYHFTSNTGVEEAVFKKHNTKLTMLSELETGVITTKNERINVGEIVKIIQTSQNINSLEEINNRFKNFNINDNLKM